VRPNPSTPNTAAPLHKRSLRFASALFALGLLAAACGDDDDTSTEDTSSTTEGDGGGEAEEGQLDLDDVCQEAKDAGVEVPDGFKVSLVTDIGRINDGTFNQYAYEGMTAAEECFGFETSYIETASEADYDKNITTSLDGDPDIIITSGSLLYTDTLKAANENPEVRFIGIDQFQPEYPDNYIGTQATEAEAGYMAGVMAASLSETGVIGVVGGREDVPPVVRLVNGYEAGAKSVNPDITVLHTYNAAFNTPDVGASDAAQFMGDGADVVFGAGGPTGSGGVKAATAAGKWGIGVDQDEYFTTFAGGTTPGAEYLAASMIKRVDYGVFEAIRRALTDEWEGGALPLTAENRGITYSDFHDADIPDDVAELLEQTRAGLADGSIETGIDPITGKPLK
jgi:basic membrane protein A and related proteins